MLLSLLLTACGSNDQGFSPNDGYPVSRTADYYNKTSDDARTACTAISDAVCSDRAYAPSAETQAKTDACLNGLYDGLDRILHTDLEVNISQADLQDNSEWPSTDYGAFATSLNWNSTDATHTFAAKIFNTSGNKVREMQSWQELEPGVRFPEVPVGLAANVTGCSSLWFESDLNEDDPDYFFYGALLAGFYPENLTAEEAQNENEIRLVIKVNTPLVDDESARETSVTFNGVVFDALDWDLAWAIDDGKESLLETLEVGEAMTRGHGSEFVHYGD